MKLYSYFRSSAAYRVRIALNLKGLDPEYIPVHLVKNGGEQHSPEYRQINPTELIPAWIEKNIQDDFTLTQSLSILEYLEEKYPDVALLPQDFQQRFNSRSQPKYCLRYSSAEQFKSVAIFIQYFGNF